MSHDHEKIIQALETARRLLIEQWVEIEHLRDSLERINGYLCGLDHYWAHEVRKIASTALGEKKS